MSVFTARIEQEDFIPVRLDKYMTEQSTGISRSRLKNGVLSIKVNNVDAKISRMVKKGDQIEIVWEDPVPEEIEAEDIPLDVLYEDERVAVINKKQGMVTHPAAGNWTGTLVNALLFHWKQKNTEQNVRAGIVHRLDKDTSGVLITARDREAEDWLQEQFRSRRVKKIYAAIVMGKPPAKHGSIKTGITRDTRNRKKFTTCDSDKGKFAHTLYSCLAVYGPYSLLLLQLKTGRTHQLRVHLKYLGCSILGDPIYGKKDALFDTATLMLHAKELGIRLPGSEQFSSFKAPIPRRFKKVLKTLKEKYKKRPWFPGNI